MALESRKPRSKLFGWKRTLKKCAIYSAMSLDHTARTSPPRNVANRIDRFLNTLQQAKRLPNRRELFWIRQALAKLEEAEYPAGEDAIEKAERALPIPEHAANDPSTNAGAPVEHLRAHLDQIMKTGA